MVEDPDVPCVIVLKVSMLATLARALSALLLRNCSGWPSLASAGLARRHYLLS
jgi:hypothetical protein